MDNAVLRGLMQATQLTRAGRLSEATALIQRSLGGIEPASSPGPHAAGEVIEGAWREVEASTDSAVAEPVDVVSAAGSGALRSGQFIDGTYANAAGERAYKLYVPSGFSGQPLPLVVMLHGCKQTPDDFAAGTQMNLRGEAQQCLVLYPAQSNAANASRCWNWFRREDQARDRGEPAILAGMTREIIGRYAVDAGKVYVAGLSAGGAMAAVMGVTHPDLFRAVGIHSGLACGSAHDLPSALAAMRGMSASIGRPAGAGGAAHAIPTIVFHGDQDKTVHPRNGADVIARSAHRDGGPGGTVAVERGQAPGGHAYTRTIHCDVDGRVVLEHWLVHGGGHAWFGGSRAGSYTDPRGPVAADEMLRFFRESA